MATYSQISTASFPALLVSKVDENQLQSDGNGCLNVSKLPITSVILPVPNIWAVAVLSWRWDTARPGTSLNVLAAVRYAKSVGIEHLFIDAISINQERSGDDLIDEVLAFSKLYETIPVIAAYDMPESGIPSAYRLFNKTIYRPWILHEVRKYRNNPLKVTYVGHQRNTGGCPAKDTGYDESFHDTFLSATRLIWDQQWNGYTNTILGVLTGEIGMSVITDFRLILPAYARIFDIAYATMSRNDFLLTAALLCQAVTTPEQVIFESHLEAEGETPKATLPPGTFSRYTVVKTAREPGSSVHHRFFDVLLDGQKVAKWKVKQRDHENSDFCILTVLAGTERLIINALTLEDEFEVFVKNERSRKECLYSGSQEEKNEPAKVEVVYIDLEDSIHSATLCE